MTNKHLDKVDHDYIRYANVWEDASVLLAGLKIQPGESVLSIASAGDNAFACLLGDPKVVVAVDLNLPQLYLTELKKEAIRILSRQEYLEFIGFEDCHTRLDYYNHLCHSLSDDCKCYWDHKLELINSGIVHSGKFERYLKTFADKVLPFIHSQSNVEYLLKKKDSYAQQAFYKKKWESWRWKFLFKLFFSKRVMGLFGRDPAFLKHVDGNVGEMIFAKAAAHLSSTSAQSNPILSYCLQGNFGTKLPLYLHEENYNLIQQRIDRVELFHGYVQDVSEKYGAFDKLNLSNIFEYTGLRVFKDLASSLSKIAVPGARLAYWNLMVKRQLSLVSNQFTSVSIDQDILDSDQGFFYSQFHVERFKL